MEETPHIEIRPNGPIVLYGDIPLKEMAPVLTFNGEPIDWHTLRDITPRRRPIELCRCGRSKRKPFCDATHESFRWSGLETADRRPYLERARGWEHGNETLTDDKPLCFSAGFCGTRTTTVWKLFESDEPAARARMREMIANCPSGRIHLYVDGALDEPPQPPQVAVLPGGPVWVRGAIPIIGADGHAWEVMPRATLCRCGASTNKPYCDGQHAKLHFDER